MTVIEATGGRLECHRCGRTLPDDEAERARWGSFFSQGRLVLLSCPRCLTPDERAQISARAGDDMWEVASARRASASDLRALAGEALVRGADAPSRGWVDALSERGRHVGVLTGDVRDGRVLALWSGETDDGRREAAFLELAIERWMALEELFVPYWVQQGAAEAARRRRS